MPERIKPPDHVVRRSDVRRVIANARAALDRFPALRLLVDGAPDDLGDVDVPDDSTSRNGAASADDDPAVQRAFGAYAREFDAHRAGMGNAPSTAPLVRALRAGGWLDVEPTADAYDLADGDDPEDPVELDALRIANGDQLDRLFAEAGVLGYDLAAGRDPVSRADRRATLVEAQALARERLEPLAGLVSSGELSPTDFRALLRREIKDVHVSAAVAAAGGKWSDLTQADWGRVGARVARQYAFADRFARDVADRARAGTPYSEAQIRARADLYAEAANQTFEAQEAANVGLDPAQLPAMPRDGTTECLVRCKCTWAIRVVSIRRGDYNARWTLHAKESCSTCLRRGRFWRSLKVRGGKLQGDVPAVNG